MLFLVHYSAYRKLQIYKIENYNIAKDVFIVFSANGIHSEKKQTLR